MFFPGAPWEILTKAGQSFGQNSRIQTGAKVDLISVHIYIYIYIYLSLSRWISLLLHSQGCFFSSSSSYFVQLSHLNPGVPHDELRIDLPGSGSFGRPKLPLVSRLKTNNFGRPIGVSPFSAMHILFTQLSRFTIQYITLKTL